MWYIEITNRTLTTETNIEKIPYKNKLETDMSAKVNHPVKSWHFGVVSYVDYRQTLMKAKYLNLHFKTWSGETTISQNQSKMFLGGKK